MYIANLSKRTCCIWPVCHCLPEPMYKMKYIMAVSGLSSSLSGLVQPTKMIPAKVPTTLVEQQPPMGANETAAVRTAEVKCKNLLTTLLRLANEQPESMASNARMLVQRLVDAKIEPEEFATKLERELNSSPQPCLVPFLKVRIN